MTDPNFRRAVVFMLDHNEEGAFGLVLNNPIATSTNEVLEPLGLSWQGDDEKILRDGGPVERMRGFVLHNQDGWDPLAEDLFPGMLLTTSLDAVIEAGVRVLHSWNSGFEEPEGFVIGLFDAMNREARIQESNGGR